MGIKRAHWCKGEKGLARAVCIDILQGSLLGRIGNFFLG